MTAIWTRKRWRWCGGGGVRGRVVGEDDRCGTGGTKAQDFLAIWTYIVDVSEVLVDAYPAAALTLDLSHEIYERGGVVTDGPSAAPGYRKMHTEDHVLMEGVEEGTRKVGKGDDL
jgi:hypothetical protein